LVVEDDDDEFMHITDARPWLNGKPDYCLNVGLTHTGLGRLVDINNIEFPGRNIADQNNAFSVTKIHDGASFPGDLIHFDYKDGIAQPQIEDAPGLRVFVFAEFG
jgi:hypothetical protein